MNFKIINVDVEVPIGDYCNLTQNRKKESCKFCIKLQGESYCNLFDKNLQTKTKLDIESYKFNSEVEKCLECPRGNK